MQSRRTLNSCLHLPSVGITGVHHMPGLLDGGGRTSGLCACYTGFPASVPHCQLLADIFALLSVLFYCPPAKGRISCKQWASAAGSGCKHAMVLQLLTALRGDIQCLLQPAVLWKHTEVGTETMLSQNTFPLFSDSWLSCGEQSCADKPGKHYWMS